MPIKHSVIAPLAMIKVSNRRINYSRSEASSPFISCFNKSFDKVCVHPRGEGVTFVEVPRPIEKFAGAAPQPPIKSTSNISEGEPRSFQLK